MRVLLSPAATGYENRIPQYFRCPSDPLFRERVFRAMTFSVMGGLNPDHMIIEAKVKPNSGKFRMEERNGMTVICTKSPAEGGKANMEIVRELAKKFGAPVRILSGQRSSKKRISIQN